MAQVIPAINAGASRCNCVPPTIFAGTSATTKVDDETCVFHWTIDGFDIAVMRTEPFKAYFSSPSMKHTWGLEFTHTWDGSELVMKLKVSLVTIGDQICHRDDRTVKAIAKFGIRDSFNNMADGSGSTSSLRIWKTGDCLPLEFPMQFATKADCKSRILRDGNLRIVCMIWIQGNQTTQTTPPYPVSLERKLNGARVTLNLANDLRDLLHSGTLSDFTIFVGNKTFNVHKAILAARSPVFAAMFQSPMSEAEQQQVIIHDFEAETIDAMIKHTYGGILPKETWRAEILNLIQIAEKYQLLHLKEDCEREFELELNVNNVCDFLAVAHVYSQSKLVPTVAKFIARNRNAVFAKEEFTKLLKEHPEMAMALYLSNSE